MVEYIYFVKKMYLKWVARIALATTGLAIISIIIIVFSQVIMRYVFRGGIHWALETAGFIFVWICFIGPLLALEENELMNIQYFRDKLPITLQKIIVVLVDITVLIVLGLLVYHGRRATLQAWSRVTPSLRHSWGFVYAALPVGFSLLFIAYLLDFIEKTARLILFLKNREM